MLIPVFLYKARQGFDEFLVHSGGILLGAIERVAVFHGPEVWAVAAVVSARDGDVLSREDVRIAFAAAYP